MRYQIVYIGWFFKKRYYQYLIGNRYERIEAIWWESLTDKRKDEILVFVGKTRHTKWYSD